MSSLSTRLGSNYSLAYDFHPNSLERLRADCSPVCFLLRSTVQSDETFGCQECEQVKRVALPPVLLIPLCHHHSYKPALQVGAIVKQGMTTALSTQLLFVLSFGPSSTKLLVVHFLASPVPESQVDTSEWLFPYVQCPQECQELLLVTGSQAVSGYLTLQPHCAVLLTL